MKLICPTCDGYKTVKEPIHWSNYTSKQPWFGDDGRVYTERDTNRTWTDLTWPRLECQTCDATGWVDEEQAHIILKIKNFTRG